MLQPMLQPMRAKRMPPRRDVAVQKEGGVSGPDGRQKTVLLVDAAQQTGRRPLTPACMTKAHSVPQEISLAILP